MSKLFQKKEPAAPPLQLSRQLSIQQKMEIEKENEAKKKNANAGAHLINIMSRHMTKLLADEGIDLGIGEEMISDSESEYEEVSAETKRE